MRSPALSKARGRTFRMDVVTPVTQNSSASLAHVHHLIAQHYLHTTSTPSPHHLHTTSTPPPHHLYTTCAALVAVYINVLWVICDLMTQPAASSSGQVNNVQVHLNTNTIFRTDNLMSDLKATEWCRLHPGCSANHRCLMVVFVKFDKTYLLQRETPLRYPHTIYNYIYKKHHGQDKCNDSACPC